MSNIHEIINNVFAWITHNPLVSSIFGILIGFAFFYLVMDSYFN